MNKYYHSVILREKECTGCTACIHICPTEAIRVIDGKARIKNDQCIDCGRCITVCPHHAKTASGDSLESLSDYEYTIALPSLPFYSQFPGEIPRNHINAVLRQLGFDHIQDLSYFAEILSFFIKDDIRRKRKKDHLPVISSYCPAVIRLVQLKHPELLPHVCSLESPMEIAARELKNKFARQLNISKEKIGIFFLAQCPAKITSIKSPLGADTSALDGSLSIHELLPLMFKLLPGIEVESQGKVPCRYGELWSISGGQRELGNLKKALIVDGIDEVESILDMIEIGKLSGIEYIEAYSCYNGCVGGPLNVENHTLARYRVQRHCCSCLSAKENAVRKEFKFDELCWKNPLKPLSGMELDQDMQTAMEKLLRVEELLKELPGIDCGACGSPSCRALAEDIVQGRATVAHCIFKRMKGDIGDEN